MPVIRPNILETGFVLQRLYSTFANGSPGKGLLILRLAVSMFLIAKSFGALTAVSGFPRAVPPIIAACAGLSLLAGLWTPVAGLLVVSIELWIAFSSTADFWPFVLAAAMAAALALLGPGAWSVDARIYGRKRIAINNLD